MQNKINKNKQTAFRLENNDFLLLGKVSQATNTSISELLRIAVKKLIQENMEVK